MIVNTVTLASVLAVLECASASAIKRRQVLKGEEKNLGSRIQGEAKIGDQCHPPGTYALGGSKPIPPCLAEQAISLKCEIVTQVQTNPSEEKWRAYHDCLAGEGSSYFEDVNGCLACKASHNHLSKEQFEWYSQRWADGQKAFTNDAVPKTTVWEYVLGGIGGTTCQQIGGNETLRGWSCWNQLPAGSGISAKDQSIEEYYKNRPKTQNIGSFTLNGKQYPEVSSVELDLMVHTFEIKAHMGYYYSAKLENGELVVGYNATSKVEILTEYREIKSICNFTKSDEFTILPIIGGSVPVKDSVVTVPKAEAANLPTVDCDASCRADAPAIEDIQNIAAQGPKPADKAVAEAATPAMQDLKNNKPISHQIEVTILETAEDVLENVALMPIHHQNPSSSQNASGPLSTIGSAPAAAAGSTGSNGQTSSTFATGSNVSGAPFNQESGSESCPDSCQNKAPGSVRVTVCQMPGEKDCKSYFY